MNRRRFAAAIGCIATVGSIFAVIAAARSPEPMLLRAFEDDGCACGELHGKVSGLVIWNPFRDRTPETVAHRFFERLRGPSNWRLAFREDRADTVRLYFRLTESGISDPQYDLSGQGVVVVKRFPSGWSVDGYSAIF